MAGQLHVFVDDETAEKLRCLAFARRLSRSALVRLMIDRAYEETMASGTEAGPSPEALALRFEADQLARLRPMAERGHRSQARVAPLTPLPPNDPGFASGDADDLVLEPFVDDNR